MNILKHINEVDGKIIDDSLLVWDWYDTYKQRDYAFVVYDSNNNYIDSIDPILKVYITDTDIYIGHGYSSLGFYKINRKELNDKGYKCYVEKEHFAYQCDNIVSEELEWLICKANS